MSSIYYCTNQNNTCPKNETCKRYKEAEGECTATLFKSSCTEDNGYVLYIKYEKKEGDNSEEFK